MSYPRVIALLDQQLERLRTARSILTSSPETVQKAEQAADFLEALPAKTELAAPPATPVPEPRVIAPKQRRERRVVSRKGKVAEESALGKAISRAPVYVSADKLKTARAEKDNIAAATTQKGEMLTPEMLSRRWLNSATS